MSAEHANGVDERAIEKDLKAMVVRAEKASDRSTSIGCVTSIVVIGGGIYLGGWKGAGIGFLLFIGSFVVAAQYDEWVLKRAARRFHAQYPHGTPAHAVAMQVLSELESEAKALEKLRGLIRQGEDATELVRRRRPEPTVEQQLGSPLETPAPRPPAPAVELLPPTPATPNPKPSPKAPPLIPLEPFEPETPAETPEKRDERDSGTRGRD